MKLLGLFLLYVAASAAQSCIAVVVPSDVYSKSNPNAKVSTWINVACEPQADTYTVEIVTKHSAGTDVRSFDIVPSSTNEWTIVPFPLPLGASWTDTKINKKKSEPLAVTIMVKN